MRRTLQILISWLLVKPADLDLHCFQKDSIEFRIFYKVHLSGQIRYVRKNVIHAFIKVLFLKNVILDICLMEFMKAIYEEENQF